MPDVTIRSAFVAVLFKQESTSGTDASPTGSADAIPVEADSVSFNSPYREENSNEATGSMVAGAPLIVGQPATVGFRSRLKGPNAVPTASIKPPIHAPLAACGYRGVFQAAIATAVLTAGTTTSATLGTGFTGTAQLYRGMPLVIGAGVGNGAIPLITDYTAGKVATLADIFGSALDTTTSTAIPANWTYAPTSPADASARLTDQPSGTCYIYKDGTLYKFIGCRGTVDFEGASAKPGFATFSFTGIFAGKSDAAMPALTIMSHSAPLMLQGSALSLAFALNRIALPISSWKLSDAGSVESPDNPNSLNGFDPGNISSRTPVLTCDPLSTLVATRDALSAISAGTIYTAALRMGYSAGNRVAITLPRTQITESTIGQRGILDSENLKLRALNTPTQDSNTRDGDKIICFY